MLLPASYVLSIVLLALVGANSDEFFILREENIQCPANSKEEWSYSGGNGPENWGEDCNKSSQSPINIGIPNMDKNLDPPVLINYDIPLTYASMINNGHTVQVTPQDGVDRAILLDGEKYTLRQFHFHWGSKRGRGSEHKFYGFQKDMEIHFVHANEKGELAVVGVLCVEFLTNDALHNIAVELERVKYKNDETQLSNNVDLNKLLPIKQAFYRYDGSLTTPPCTEGVKWSVAKDIIFVGTDEMSAFRNLYSTTEDEATEGCKLVNNYRPVQNLNGRHVHLSYNNEVKTE